MVTSLIGEYGSDTGPHPFDVTVGPYFTGQVICDNGSASAHVQCSKLQTYFSSGQQSIGSPLAGSLINRTSDGIVSIAFYSNHFDTDPILNPYGQLCDPAVNLTFNTNTNTGSIIFSFEDLSGGYLLGTITQFTMQPVPEPATMILFGTGIVGLVSVGRKKRN